MLVDTHLHLIDKSRLDYPWIAGEPALDRDFLYGEYARDALRAGITDVLHMEVDVAPSDIAGEVEFVREQSRKPGSLIRGAISACRPEDQGFAAALERALADPFVKGFRRVLHVVPDEVSQGALFRANVKRLSGTRLTFDIVMSSTPGAPCAGARRPRARRHLHPRPLRRARYQGRRLRRLEARHFQIWRRGRT